MASARCDNEQQCIDGSDQHRCQPRELKERPSVKLPIRVEFQRTGDIARTSLQKAGPSAEVSCPETHFWCLDKDYCLPVFVHCNGVYDCPGHEDETGCDLYTCPGFYRCRASKVCVHVTHVCDGWPLCPQRDDELLCHAKCPLQCTCFGLAFFCNKTFAAQHFRDLRYLNAEGSRINARHLDYNDMLIHLSLARCDVRTVTNFTFHNLHSLDLSENQLTEVSGFHFRHMPLLTALFLAGNPLNSVFKGLPNSNIRLPSINTLDLSRLKMHAVDDDLFMVFPNLQRLNLSGNSMKLLQWNSSVETVVKLKELDLRGCVIEELSLRAVKGFLHLQLLFSDNFKLCCPSVLPSAFDLNHCHATPDDVSSCDDLLGSVTYRATVEVLATLAMVGNVVSLTLRVCVHSTWRLSSGSVILTHLSVADLGMGLYLTTLGLADRLLAGQYVWLDNTWKKGVVCHLAGALALSCRLSATFFITILILDRWSKRCPVLTSCLTPASVKALCVALWAISLLLAAIPLSPQWQFFGQQALCIPLAHKRTDSMESSYSNTVLVLVTFAMFVLCSVCEMVNGVFGRVKNCSNMSKISRPNGYKFVVLGSLISGFLYTIACLVPTDSHTNRQKATQTALVYFGSVISSAINPYLHLYGVRVEQSKRIKEERLLMIINRARV